MCAYVCLHDIWPVILERNWKLQLWLRECNVVCLRFLCGNAQGSPEWERYDFHISKEPLSHPASINCFGKYGIMLGICRWMTLIEALLPQKPVTIPFVDHFRSHYQNQFLLDVLSFILPALSWSSYVSCFPINMARQDEAKLCNRFHIVWVLHTHLTNKILFKIIWNVTR